MKTRHTGFTMIELIVVIVILGILAAVAIPRFINMSADAERAAVAGVAGAAGSAMTLNYSGCALTNQAVTANKCVKVTSCATATVSSLLQGGLPAGYTSAASAAGTEPATIGATAVCAVSKTSGTTTYTADFIGMGAGT